MLKVHEIFASIQGEGLDTGKPCVFLRLFGCNLNCSYCDQPQSNHKSYNIDTVLRRIRAEGRGIKEVCITGGEPMVQWSKDLYPLVVELVSSGYSVSIETNGCVPLPDIYNRKFKYVMDIKCPSSGMSDRNIYDNIMLLQARDELKFVVGCAEDYEFAKSILRKYGTPAQILFSPLFLEETPVVCSELVDWVLKDRLYNARVQVQLHKVLGVK